jgi:sigma-E factor negative regulatory protein RseC
MDTILAKIVSISGQTAIVNVANVAVCPRCAAGKGCGAGLFGASSDAATVSVKLPDAGTYREGETIQLAIPAARLLHASLLAYGLPLAGALLFILLGRFVLQPMSDGAGIALAVAGLLVGFFAGRRQLQNDSCARRFQPVVLNDPAGNKL